MMSKQEIYNLKFGTLFRVKDDSYPYITWGIVMFVERTPYYFAIHFRSINEKPKFLWPNLSNQMNLNTVFWTKNNDKFFTFYS